MIDNDLLVLATQVAYIPSHATVEGLTHKDVEFGFVTSDRGSTVMCRYWLKQKPGELRTRANSESTLRDNLVRHASVEQRRVEDTLRLLGYVYWSPRSLSGALGARLVSPGVIGPFRVSLDSERGWYALDADDGCLMSQRGALDMADWLNRIEAKPEEAKPEEAE